MKSLGFFIGSFFIPWDGCSDSQRGQEKRLKKRDSRSRDEGPGTGVILKQRFIFPLKRLRIY
jgi:hypothetical protein